MKKMGKNAFSFQILTRFGHENIIDIRDIIHANTMDEMKVSKDVVVVGRCCCGPLLLLWAVIVHSGSVS